MTDNIVKQEQSITRSKLDIALASRIQGQRVILLLDVSGSMAQPAGYTNESRINALISVVESLKQKKIPFRQAVFSSSISWSDIIPSPSGGTNLSAALDFCKSANAQHVIVVSDGGPDSRDAALESARRLGAKIDVFFVGSPSDSYGQEFMQELAKLSGGSSQSTSFKELERGVIGMLTAGNEDEKKKSIAL